MIDGFQIARKPSFFCKKQCFLTSGMTATSSMTGNARQSVDGVDTIKN